MKDGATRAREEKERLMKLAGIGQPTDETPPADADTPADPPADDVTPPTPVDPPADETFKAKYDTLLGKYNAEVPRLHESLRQKDVRITELTQENNDLLRQITDLKATPATVPTVEKDDDGNPHYFSPHLTDEMRDTDTYRYYLQEYGRTHAERHMEGMVIAARNTIKPVEEKVSKVEAQTEADAAWDQYLVDLTNAVSDWREINKNDEFIAWLQNPVPGLGQTYHQLLIEVHNAGNVVRTSEIFNLFKSTIKAPAPTPKPTIPPHLAAPPKSGGGAQTVIENNQGQVMRMSDLEELYQAFSRGEYRGREQDYEKKKREFMQAKAEGRLV